jgi:dihydroorotate dehydrogenase (fumarate)
MEEHEYESVQQMKGSMSQLHCPNPSEFERVQYVRSLQTIQPDSLSRTSYTL